MTLSKGEKIRIAIRDNPLKTDRDKKRFKKQVLDLVNDYVMFVLDEFGERHMKLEKLEKQVLKMFKNWQSLLYIINIKYDSVGHLSRNA